MVKSEFWGRRAWSSGVHCSAKIPRAQISPVLETLSAWLMDHEGTDFQEAIVAGLRGRAARYDSVYLSEKQDKHLRALATMAGIELPWAPVVAEEQVD